MMKQTTILALLFCLSLGAFASRKTIKNPAIEFQRSGINFIKQIELTDSATLLTMYHKFLPSWWVSYNADDYIEDYDTGKKYRIKEVIGGKFDEHIKMPKSGDSTFVIAFEPLDKGVDKINYAINSYGISLSKKQSTPLSTYTILPEVKKWLDTKMPATAQNKPSDFDSPEFFTTDTAHLLGCIKGYDRRSEFSTGIIYVENVLTRENYPIVVPIEEDGRFSVDVPMVHSQIIQLSFERSWIPIYMEPGQTQGMIIDWYDFMESDRNRHISYQFKHTEYLGSFAKFNSELASFEIKRINNNQFSKYTKTKTPDEFKEICLKHKQHQYERFDEFAQKNTISEEAQTIYRNRIELISATNMFDYVSRRAYEARKDTSNKVMNTPVELPYYDFLLAMQLNNKSLLVAPEFKSFVNRFEYMPVYKKIVRTPSKASEKPKASLYEYFVEEKIEMSKEVSNLLQLIDKETKSEEEKEQLENSREKFEALNENYKEQIQAYIKKYITPLQKSAGADRQIDYWKQKENILQADLGLHPELIYDITKIRSLNFEFEHSSKEVSKDLWTYLKNGIKAKGLIEHGNRIFAEAFPAEKIDCYDLPSGYASEVFKNIIAPFKGKILFIDFWATSCGPCIAGIKKMKETREKYKNNPDFEFVFITDERSSPETAYQKFVTEQDMGNTFRLSKDDYNYLRQLFKFNGIPRYVVIDKNGKVLNDDFEMHQFARNLDDILSAK